MPRPAPRVVHLGLGAFHRAHQAVVFDELGWGVTGASLRSPVVRAALAPQDCLYSLVTGEEVRVIGAVREVLLDTPALLARSAKVKSYRQRVPEPEPVVKKPGPVQPPGTTEPLVGCARKLPLR